MREHARPCVFMPLLRFLVGKAGVGEAEKCAAAARSKLDGHLSFGAPGCRSNPRQFNELRALQPKEAAIMGMPLTFKFRLEEDRIDMGLHRAIMARSLVNASGLAERSGTSVGMEPSGTVQQSI